MRVAVDVVRIVAVLLSLGVGFIVDEDYASDIHLL